MQQPVEAHIGAIRMQFERSQGYRQNGKSLRIIACEASVAFCSTRGPVAMLPKQ